MRYLLDHWARVKGDQVYAIFEGGRSFTFREMREQVISVAAGLARLGAWPRFIPWLPAACMLAFAGALGYGFLAGFEVPV